MLKWHFLCFNLCPLPLCLSLDDIEKSLPSAFFTLLIRYLYALISSFLEPYVLQAEQSQLLQLPLVRFSHPLITFIPFTCSSVSMSLSQQVAQNWIQHLRCLTNSEGKDNLPQPAARALHNAALEAVGGFAAVLAPV